MEYYLEKRIFTIYLHVLGIEFPIHLWALRVCFLIDARWSLYYMVHSARNEKSTNNAFVTGNNKFKIICMITFQSHKRHLILYLKHIGNLSSITNQVYPQLLYQEKCEPWNKYYLMKCQSGTLTRQNIVKCHSIYHLHLWIFKSI